MRQQPLGGKRLAERAKGVGRVELVRRAPACLWEGGDEEIGGGWALLD